MIGPLDDPDPGEPVRGAPVMVQCRVPECRARWHVQCIAPEAVPGDGYDFRSERWWGDVQTGGCKLVLPTA